MVRPRGAMPAELSRSGWGDPAQARELPAAVGELWRTGLGITRATPSPRAIEALSLAAPRLAAPVADRLSATVGTTRARGDHAARARHALGRSTLDLLALRAGARLPAPDLVLAPGSAHEVMAILGICSAARVAVVPFGGGTSVVGGVTPDADGFAAWVALDLVRLDAVHEVDTESRLARLGPGLRGPDAEARLGAHGYTIGHFPQSFEPAALSGFAAARSSGQASSGYGRFDDLVAALRVATPSGELALGRAPKSAAGPDLRQLVLGSAGAFGVITELTVRVRPVPEAGSMTAGGCRTSRPAAPCCVVSPRTDPSRPCSGSQTRRRPHSGPRALPRSVPARRSPRRRPLVETLETVAFWRAVPDLYTAVTAALRETLTAAGTPPIILCHVSHVYPTGASLYFTVACAQAHDPAGQWRAAKHATGAAILAHGGSISHHHGIGRDHREELAQEFGDLGCSCCGRSSTRSTRRASSIREYSLLSKTSQCSS